MNNTRQLGASLADNSLWFSNFLGKSTIALAKNIGSGFVFVLQVLKSSLSLPIYVNNILHHLLHIGFFSVPIVGLTCFFSGAVLALQTFTGFSRFAGESAIAGVVIISVTRELAPVMAGLMVAGRVGAAMAAEIGTMKVTEQVDALFTLSAHPLRYLIVPRVLATIISMPLLVLMGDIIGVYGGYVVSIYKLGFNQANYIVKSFNYLKTDDVTSGLIKAVVFGGILSLVSCYFGYFAKKGAKGVGESTTKAVVTSSILILVANYFVTEMMF